MDYEWLISMPDNIVGIYAEVNGQKMECILCIPQNMPVKKIIGISHNGGCFFDVFILCGNSWILPVYSVEFRTF